MTNSLKCKVKHLCHNRTITESERDRILKALEKEDILNKIREEIEKVVWEDVIVSPDGLDEVRIPCLDPDDVFDIIDKYKAESEYE